MHKLTIIVALVIGSMAFAQPGKSHGNGDHSTKNMKNESFGNKNNAPSAQGGQGGQGHNGNKGGPGKQGGSGNQGKNAFKDQGSNGGQGNGGYKENNNHNKPVFNQDKGHGNNGNKSHKVNHPGNGKQSYGQPGNKDKGNNGKGNGKNHSGKMHYDKGHPNFGYLYVNKHGYFSHSNYGQWRSVQARNKHKHYHPIYEYQAIEGFNLIIVRNRFLFTETDYKMNLLRVRLADRRRAGLISVVEFDNRMNTIALLERRRATLEVNIVL